MRGLVLITMVLLTACSKKSDAPSCEQVADKMIALTKTTANKANLVAECEHRKVTPAQRRCMVDAKDMGALATCVGKKRASRQEENPAPQPRDQPDPHAGMKFAPNDPHMQPLAPRQLDTGSGSATN